MPNICSYSMRVQGKPQDVEEVIKTVQSSYNYSDMEFDHTRHLFRVFESEIIKDEEDDGIRDVIIDGDCAWSVHTSMRSGEGSYYDSAKETHREIFRGTHLEELSKDTHTMIEVFGEECEMGFEEHYLYKFGELLIEDVQDEENGWDFVEYNE